MKDEGLLGVAFLLGATDEPASFLAQLDVFVMPSRVEGLGLALIEALAVGLPCVASNVGGIPEVLDPRCGILVEPNSPLELARAMAVLLSQNERESRARFARERALKFSCAECARKHADLYGRLLKKSTISEISPPLSRAQSARPDS